MLLPQRNLCADYSTMSQDELFRQSFGGIFRARQDFESSGWAWYFHKASSRLSQKTKGLNIPSIITDQIYSEDDTRPASKRGQDGETGKSNELGHVYRRTSENCSYASDSRVERSPEEMETCESYVKPSKSYQQRSLFFRPWMTTNACANIANCRYLGIKSSTQELNPLLFSRKIEPSKCMGSRHRMSRKRKRTVFTPGQIQMLESSFSKSQFLQSEEKMRLATALGIDEITVKIWFQNRRMKLRRQKFKIDKSQHA